MNIDVDFLNRKYLGFLEEEYGFKYSNGIFSAQDIEVSIVVTGFTAGVLSSVEIYIWFKEEPKCTQISFEWVATYYLGTRLYLEESFNSLLKNYQKLSSVFREYAPKILCHREEWLLPSMKVHFEWMLNNLFGGNLQRMLTGPNVLEMYNYIKSKDPNWNPQNGS